jgi:hypothetical protein
MIHIVFQHADVNILNEAMKLDENLSGEIIEIKDEWGVGPLQGLHTEEGWKARGDWWRELLKDSPYGEKLVGSFDDRETVTMIKEKMNADSELETWIWMGQNQHDVTGYFWLMPQLREYQGRLMILYLNNLPFINEKGQLFYPNTIHEILPREAVKAKKLVRILEGGKKIVGKEETFYDNEILKNITGEWQKAWRVLSNTLHRMKIKTGDVFLMWRMKHLINEGRIEVLGNVSEGWKEFDVKLPGTQAAAQTSSSEEAAA